MKLETSASQKEKETDCSNFIRGSITGSPLIFEAFRRVYLGEREESDITPVEGAGAAFAAINAVEIGNWRIK